MSSQSWLLALRAKFSARTTPAGDAIASAALRSDRFRLEREGDWQRLEAIVTAMESGQLKKLSDADLLDLPVLYRAGVSSLSIARQTSLDAATLAYLEALVQRAWFLVYGPRLSLWGWLAQFFAGGWPRAVRGMAREIAICLGVMVAGTALGWVLVAQDPSWYAALFAGGAGDVRLPGASRAALHGTLFGGQDQDGLAAFAAYLVSHNAQIAILAFALGFLLGLPSLLLLVQNTGSLGAMLWLFHGAGLTWDVVGWLAIHGTTELFAILLAGAAGLHIGLAIAFPGQQAILASAAAAGRRAAVVMTGAVFMLLVAGMLEGFARQLIQNTPMRLAIGGAMLAGWILYFIRIGRARP